MSRDYGPVHQANPNAVLRGGRGHGLFRRVSEGLPTFVGYPDGLIEIYDPTEEWDEEYPHLRVYVPRKSPSEAGTA
jgi:hypothetical protein